MVGILKSESVGNAICRVQLDAASTIALAAREHLDVTLITPVGSPRVSDEIIGLSLFDAVANGGDSMVKFA